MSRQLLVIHDSRTVRNIIKRQVLAEAPDLVVHDAGCHDEAKDMIKNQPFDIAICDDALSGIDGLSLCLDAKKQSLNPDIAFILLLAPTAAAHRVPLLERNGFANYLVSPFTQEQLVAQIAAVCDPRKKRMHRRISIPKCKALLKFDAKEYRLNLSISACPASYASSATTTTAETCFASLVSPCAFPPNTALPRSTTSGAPPCASP
jgi:DNA-binding response OmpR family regulator